MKLLLIVLLLLSCSNPTDLKGEQEKAVPDHPPGELVEQD